MKEDPHMKKVRATVKAVQEATNSHDYKHKAGNYETWSSMNKDPDWTRYEN